MPKKKDLIKVGYFFYFLLSFVVYFHREEPVESDYCPFDFACVRFCCPEAEYCGNNFNESKFNKSLVSKQKFAEIKYLFSKPSCPSLQALDENVTWAFDFTGRIFLRNSSLNYAQNFYCVKSQNISQGGAVAWDVSHCDEENRLRSIFYNCLMGVALVFVAATLVTYVRSNTLRTLHGKCEFMFLLGLLLIHLAYPWKVEFHRLRRLLIKLLYLGCLMTAFWKNVLVFDIWWTFRHRRAPEDELLRFTNYCYYAFGLIGAYLMILLVELVVWQVNYGLYTMLCFLAVTTFVEVLLLLSTSVIVFRTARTLRSADHRFFKAERERFQSYFISFVIVSFSWFVALFLDWNIVSVFMISFSSFLIFANFAWKKLLTLTHRHKNIFYFGEVVAL